MSDERRRERVEDVKLLAEVALEVLPGLGNAAKGAGAAAAAGKAAKAGAAGAGAAATAAPAAGAAEKAGAAVRAVGTPPAVPGSPPTPGATPSAPADANRSSTRSGGVGQPGRGRQTSASSRQLTQALGTSGATTGSGTSDDPERLADGSVTAGQRARDAKAGARDLGRGSLSGAASGLGLGTKLGTIVPVVGNAAGATIGAAVGAVAGGAAAVRKSSALRRTIGALATGAGVIGVLLLALQLTIASSVVHAAAGVANSASNLVAAGLSIAADGSITGEERPEARQELTEAKGLAAVHGVRWELVLWLLRNAPDELARLDELALALHERLPDPDDRNLTNGAVIAEGGWLVLGEREEDLTAQQAVEGGHLAALEAFGLAAADARAAFQQARAWALGAGAYRCGDSTLATLTAGAGSGYGELTAEQTQNANLIIAATKAYLAALTAEQQRRAGIIAIATAMQESGLRILDYGDAAGPDSRGLYQQRDSWGTLEQRLDAVWSTAKFLSVLMTVPGWDTLSLGEASYKVQIFREDLAHHYDEKEPAATALWDALAAAAPAVTIPADLGTWDPAGAGRGTGAATAGATCLTGGSIAAVTGLPVNPEHGSISDWFGARSSPTAGASTNHKGIDIAAKGIANPPLYAIADGTVTQAACGSGGYGCYLAYDIGNDTVILYAHLAEAPSVTVGQRVTAGQQVAIMGSTGVSTGTHLHLEVQVEGVPIDPADSFGGKAKLVETYGSSV